MSTSENPRTGNSQSLSAYYNASRLRTDMWDRLKLASQSVLERKNGSVPGELLREIEELLGLLQPIESYWAYPGRARFSELVRLFREEEYHTFCVETRGIVRRLISDDYRRRDVDVIAQEDSDDAEKRSSALDSQSPRGLPESRPYFEVLVVDNIGSRDQRDVRQRLLSMRRSEDEFIYDLVFVPTFEDALVAILFNYNIQSVVVRYSFPLRSENKLEILHRYMDALDDSSLHEMREAKGTDRSLVLGNLIRKLRPELDLFLVTDAPVEDIAGRLNRDFRRVFFRQEDYLELHLSMLKGIAERFDTPFFTALRNYSRRPTGVFHAMPVSRSKSIAKSHWIQDMEKFYGSNIFLAETSATTSGLDSLLQPHGSLKKAQELAARAFGARRTFFVTNGTSTANKIVMQGLVQPEDIVLVSRDCHKSHHYALILSGARSVYMDPYPVSEYSMYGAVPLREIKRTLLRLKAEGKLDRVRMLLLTNCTFDGVTYHPLRVMQEILAIKPDIIFLWDEAWFAYAHFTPTSRGRMAMSSARALRDRFRSPEYAQEYAVWKSQFGDPDPGDPKWLDTPLLPDPARVRLRVYSTQSTHKTLTALRQGSMIHVWDQDFEMVAEEPFLEAYMTHTSTSPNYQILASLDVGRRQVELEGYEFVQKSVELAMMFRERVNNHPLLRKYFRIVGPKDLIPPEFRPSNLEYYYDRDAGWSRMEDAWHQDEFALDPTRVTLHIGRTGMNGDAFKNHLIDRYDIQINKTSRNTVLFLIHIGTTRGSVAYLIETLTAIAMELEERSENYNSIDAEIHKGAVASLVDEVPPLPNFSRFHEAFLDHEGGIDGSMREAFFASYEAKNCEYMPLNGTIKAALESGRTVVSASFITPYPPGFPVLVPGQVISAEILAFLRALDVTEIHGYKPRYGLKVFREETLQNLLGRRRAAANPSLHGSPANGKEVSRAQGSNARTEEEVLREEARSGDR